MFGFLGKYQRLGPVFAAALALVLIAAAVLIGGTNGNGPSTQLRADERAAGSDDDAEEVTPTTDTSEPVLGTTGSSLFTTTLAPVATSIKPVVGRPTTTLPISPGFGPGRIAFERGGGAYSVAPDGSDEQQLSGGTTAPSWSPDRFSFVGNAGGVIVVHDRHGRTQSVPEYTQDNHPAWSPDGSLVALGRYAHSEIGCCAIWVMRPDGSNARRLADSNCISSEPAWTPDSKQIVFWSSREFCGQNDKPIGMYELFIMNVDGSGLRRLGTAENSGAPSVSPDGTKVVFASDRDDHHTDRAGTWEIYVMNIDGSGQKRITTSPGDDLEPDWSPDGSRIAFYSARDGGGLFTMKPDGTDVRKIASGAAKNPSW